MVQQLGQEKIDQTVAQSDTPGRKAIGYGIAVVGGAAYLLLVSAAFMGILNMMDARLSYPQSLGALAYSAFPFSLVTALMSGLILWLSSDRAALDLRNLIPLNPAAFMDPAGSRPLYSLASSMDLLSFGQIAMIGFGYSQVSGRSFTKCVSVVIAAMGRLRPLKDGLVGRVLRPTRSALF